ncbi:DUF1444 domain-containing protein [Salisediminibacterium beveridgei]|uniref:Uncharacterized protein n=1 Tax=Salisediminibacterium beveridgei TaxID=632773 RepID=A0A1D7QT04_9BACI|nr:DUF1444 domain-containing protein [Salisediminibacterium beveridgei]AOM82135.1 hypothetical protein BBEV_0764 [Salisediminibacterium beveridgei]
MKPIEMKRMIEQEITNENWTTAFDRDRDTLKITDKRVDKGITIQLSNLSKKFKDNPEDALEDTMKTISEGMRLLTETVEIIGKEDQIYPVLRTPSFQKEKEDGVKLVYDEHTAETTIFYAVDEGASYMMIDEQMLEKAGKSAKEIKEIAHFNLRKLPTVMTSDSVAGNTFHFLNTEDGYDASRILNQAFLEQKKEEIHGEMAIAVPHHDVLIIADIRNEAGYDVLAQMAFQFFSEGRVPLTALSFFYDEGELEPVFILAQKKPKKDDQ